MTANVVMYSTTVCTYFRMAEQLLKNLGVTEIKKILIDNDEKLRAEMMEKTSRRTVPQIFIGDTQVGRFDDLSALDKAGELMPLLEKA